MNFAETAWDRVTLRTIISSWAMSLPHPEDNFSGDDDSDFWGFTEEQINSFNFQILVICLQTSSPKKEQDCNTQASSLPSKQIFAAASGIDTALGEGERAREIKATPPPLSKTRLADVSFKQQDRDLDMFQVYTLLYKCGSFCCCNW